MTTEGILEKHSQIIEILEDERVATIEPFNNQIYLTEGCDGYFSLTLTKENCLQISELFKDLSEVCMS